MLEQFRVVPFDVVLEQEQFPGVVVGGVFEELAAESVPLEFRLEDEHPDGRGDQPFAELAGREELVQAVADVVLDPGVVPPQFADAPLAKAVLRWFHTPSSGFSSGAYAGKGTRLTGVNY